MTKIAYILLLLLLLAAPAAAQDDVSPLIWIPADFSGFVRLDMHNPGETINQLNLSAYVASRIQRERAIYNGFPEFSDFFPLDILDTEDVTFESQVLPWVQGEVVLAYRRFDATFGVAPDVPPNPFRYAVSELVLTVKSCDPSPGAHTVTRAL